MEAAAQLPYIPIPLLMTFLSYIYPEAKVDSLGEKFITDVDGSKTKLNQ